MIKLYGSTQVVTFVATFVIAGFNLAVVETLLNPILSDMFGLDVESTSYIIFGIVSLYIIVQILV